MQEVIPISKPAPVRIQTTCPDGEAAGLSRQAARIHADAVIRRLRELPCPQSGKLQLLELLLRETAGQEGPSGP